MWARDLSMIHEGIRIYAVLPEGNLRVATRNAALLLMSGMSRIPLLTLQELRRLPVTG